jgi:hypothetical protein
VGDEGECRGDEEGPRKARHDPLRHTHKTVTKPLHRDDLVVSSSGLEGRKNKRAVVGDEGECRGDKERHRQTRHDPLRHTLKTVTKPLHRGISCHIQRFSN